MRAVVWRKSGYSGDHGTVDCVELAALGQGVGIRDSKIPEADHIAVSLAAFAELVSRIKQDELSI